MSFLPSRIEEEYGVAKENLDELVTSYDDYGCECIMNAYKLSHNKNLSDIVEDIYIANRDSLDEAADKLLQQRCDNCENMSPNGLCDIGFDADYVCISEIMSGLEDTVKLPDEIKSVTEVLDKNGCYYIIDHEAINKIRGMFNFEISELFNVDATVFEIANITALDRLNIVANDCQQLLIPSLVMDNSYMIGANTLVVKDDIKILKELPAW